MGVMDTIIEIQSERTVPVGYKHTELGIIPEDWDVSPLAKHTLFVGSGKTNTKSKGSFPLFGSTGQIGSCLNPEYDGDAILIARVGANAGKLSFVSGQYGVSDNTLIVKLKPQNNIHFYKYWLIFKNLNSLVFGSGQPLITGTQLKELSLPIPSINEQTAIANVLSDTDALISKIEQLIAKKQAIKTATMQHLLTGRTRLPQFAKQPDGTLKGYKSCEAGLIPEDWDCVYLNSLVSVLDAGVSVNSLDGADIFSHGKHILKTSCVNNGYFDSNEKKSILPIDVTRAKCSPVKGGIIISRMNTPALVGEIGYVAEDEPCIFLPDRLWQMKLRKDFDNNPRWLAYLLSFPFFSHKIKETATGTSGSMKNISKDSLLSLQIPLPKPQEQIAIATILSDMDAELEALEQKLAKVRDIKQGMMQQLLTGRIRLPLDQQP